MKKKKKAIIGMIGTSKVFYMSWDHMTIHMM